MNARTYVPRRYRVVRYDAAARRYRFAYYTDLGRAIDRAAGPEGGRVEIRNTYGDWCTLGRHQLATRGGAA